MIQLQDKPAAQAPPRPALSEDRLGATAIEYALLGAMVAIIAIGGLVLMGDSATGIWVTVGDEVGTAIDDAQAD